MSLVATQEQKQLINQQGFFVLENLLTADEVAVLNQAFDEVAERIYQERKLTPDQNLGVRNGLVQHPAILDLVDRPDILEYIVDIIGWNIQNRDSVLLWTPPQPADTDPAHMSLGWHFDYEEEFAGLTGGGPMPWLDFKVGWYISDATESGHASIMFVPGSHLWTYEQRAAWSQNLNPDQIFELRVPPGSALLWRPTLLHGVTPNLSTSVRKAIYISYAPRWLRPSGHINQDPELVKASSPIRRQLLGEMGDLSHPLGLDPKNAPDSQYWFTHNWDTVPLKDWAEQRAGSPPYDWGTGYGISTTKGPEFVFTDATDPRK